MSATESQGAWARSASAVAEPAGPPPTIATSNVTRVGLDAPTVRVATSHEMGWKVVEHLGAPRPRTAASHGAGTAKTEATRPAGATVPGALPECGMVRTTEPTIAARCSRSLLFGQTGTSQPM